MELDWKQISPCPFCGEKQGLLPPGAPIFAATEFFMECLTCGARGPGADDVRQAIAKWNRRPTSTLGDGGLPSTTGATKGVIRLNTPELVEAARVWVSNPRTNTELRDDAGEADMRPDDLTAAREKRELEGLPTITTTADQGGVGMDFNMFGPPPKPRKR